MIYYDEFLECYRIKPCFIAFLLACFIWGMAWAIVTIF